MQVLVVEKMKLLSEFYFAIILDRAFMVYINRYTYKQLSEHYLQGPAMVASPYGGVNIEEIAKASPSYIYKDGIDITTGKGV
jgi:succinyl-CoA synthetase beta subunit